MSEANTKLAVLTEKVDNLENNLLHKLRNQEMTLKYIYDEINDFNKKLKWTITGIFIAFAATQSGGIEFLKALM